MQLSSNYPSRYSSNSWSMDHANVRWCSSVYVFLQQTMPSVSILGREGRNADNERMARVATRWSSSSFQGAFLSLLSIREFNIHHALLQSQSLANQIAEALSLSQLLCKATYTHLPDVRNHAYARLQKLATPREGTSYSSSHRIHVLIYCRAIQDCLPAEEPCSILGCGSEICYVILYCGPEGTARFSICLP